jgi:predicted PurR-regulated permease PerM
MRRPGFRARFTHTTDTTGGAGADAHETEVFEIEPGALERVFVAPPWLRDAGVVAWLLVGIVLVIVGLIWLLALTSTIVIPVITATLIAAVGAPLVATLQRRGVPRAAGAALLLLVIVLLGAVLGVLVLAGITSQSGDISSHLNSAAGKLANSLKDLGVSDSSATSAQNDATSSVDALGKVFLSGIAKGVEELASLAAFLAFTVLSLFFLLKDGPSLRRWVERHSGVPPAAARIVTGDTMRALRGYFTGVTIVAAFSAVIVGIGALIIGVPLAATIAIVTFLGGYIPYIGAWTAGAFAVLIALGGSGTEAAIAMAIVALAANGVLQQMVQPLAMGAALGIHPLAVLILTIGGGALFGMIGLVLAAPLASAIVRISADLARARAATEEEDAAAPTEPLPASG